MKLIDRVSKLKKIVRACLMMILILTILTACQSFPKNEEEIKRILDPGYFPELINIDDFSAAKKRIVLDFMDDVYSEHLKLLLSAKTTGYFTDDIELEILDCRDALEWLKLKKKENDLID